MFVDQLHKQFVPRRIRSDRVRHRAILKLFWEQTDARSHTDTHLSAVLTTTAHAPSSTMFLPIWGFGIQRDLPNSNSFALSVRHTTSHGTRRVPFTTALPIPPPTHPSGSLSNLSSHSGYPGTDVFIICFSIFQPQSFRNVYEQVRDRLPLLHSSLGSLPRLCPAIISLVNAGLIISVSDVVAYLLYSGTRRSTNIALESRLSWLAPKLICVV